MTDGAAFYQLQEEIRTAFECTVVDLPRSMLVNHPHLITDVQVAVLVTELTLASARDAIRILSWFKSNAPQTKVVVVANCVPSGGALEVILAVSDVANPGDPAAGVIDLDAGGHAVGADLGPGIDAPEHNAAIGWRRPQRQCHALAAMQPHAPAADCGSQGPLRRSPHVPQHVNPYQN